MSNSEYQKKAIEYYLLSIIDAKLAYVLLKSLWQSRCSEIVGESLHEKYVWVWKQHNEFFRITEHCVASTFITKILHGFDDSDPKDRSLTLKDIDQNAYINFVNEEQNKKILDRFRKLRNKRIAHHDKEEIDLDFPSFNEIDAFFERLEKFYDALIAEIEGASVVREQDRDLKQSIEKVFQNLYVGEKNRLLQINTEYMWNKDPKKISNR